MVSNFKSFHNYCWEGGRSSKGLGLGIGGDHPIPMYLQDQICSAFAALLLYQVMGLAKGHSARQVIKGLIKDDGRKGLYRGLGTRFFSMSAWGTSMILAYEYLKRVCAKED